MPDIFDQTFPTLQIFINDSISKGSPVAIGQALLSLAMCMQQMPPSYDATHLRLPQPPYDLADTFAREVYRLVLADDDLAGTFEGIECLVVYNKFCTVAG